MSVEEQQQQQRSSSQTSQHKRHSSSLSKKQSKDTLSRRHSERHQVMKIQNYVIYRKTIGAGSMGKVKLAECLTDEIKQKYAVKIMPKVDLLAMANSVGKSTTARSKDPKDTPEEREQRTIREMAIMRLLRHPNICQLKEYITEGDKYYMFLEYVDGGQLLDYIIKHGKLREKQARKFARQIVSALDYCHRNSIVHRDLKIENILITQTEQLKIIDFGLSNVYSPTQQLNTFCGSLYFAAPELLQAKQYTGPEVDVWSFGVVLYVLVCGKVPFDDTNLPALHEKIKSGVVEDYPDHLGKDCLDLLHKIFVVDPSKRITLSAIQTHPWMTKGFEEPIRNYLPHRQPLEKIDMDIVRGMDGFGLGTPEEIAEKLQRILSSSAYQVAATKIDQNFQKRESDDEKLASRPRWRRTLSTRRKLQIHDDFQTLPAMYDPLVSIYYLVKERRESDERKKQLLSPPSSSVGLSRSTSTRVIGTKNSYATQNPASTPPIAGKKTEEKPPLTRRSTFDATKKLPDLPNFFSSNKTPTLNVSTSEVTSKTPPPVRRGTLLRQKSLQAVKKLGIKLPSHSNDTASANKEETLNTKSSSSSQVTNTSNLSLTSSVTTNNTTHVNKDENSKPSRSNSVLNNSNASKPHWVKLELSSRNNLSNKQQKRQSYISTSTSNNAIAATTSDSEVNTTRPPSWKKMSLTRKSSNNTRVSFDNPSTDPTISHGEPRSNNSTINKSNADVPPPIVMTSSKSETLSRRDSKKQGHPKTIFNFNRGHLFRVTPEKMMRDLQQVLASHDIQVKPSADQEFTLECQCPYSVWSKYIHLSHHQRKQSQQFNSSHDESMMRDDEPFSMHSSTPSTATTAADGKLAVLNFHIMIYEARWAGGKIGFKVKEDQYQQNAALSFYIKQVLKNLYNCFLNEISHPNHSALAVASTVEAR